jgi:hypothetical protein
MGCVFRPVGLLTNLANTVGSLVVNYKTSQSEYLKLQRREHRKSLILLVEAR